MKKILKEQIWLRRDERPLIGKTVKDMSYLPERDGGKCIITFTDDTFVFLEAAYQDFECTEFGLSNGDVVPVSQIDDGAPGSICADGKFHFYKDIAEQIRLGIISGSEEECQKIAEEKKKREDSFEYECYLRLKAKYEGNEI